ncbi:hypothetical protein ACLQ2Q_22130 [Microbacterium sp. DT81.1]|uniref:hypothetical protein n=1 Tax=Microbacterium sp. DT81.1 TaxID=3393413 RepID=UPI003CEBBFBE
MNAERPPAQGYRGSWRRGPHDPPPASWTVAAAIRDGERHGATFGANAQRGDTPIGYLDGRAAGSRAAAWTVARLGSAAALDAERYHRVYLAAVTAAIGRMLPPGGTLSGREYTDGFRDGYQSDIGLSS